jgi:hypothetical protein
VKHSSEVYTGYWHIGRLETLLQLLDNAYNLNDEAQYTQQLEVFFKEYPSLFHSEFDNRETITHLVFEHSTNTINKYIDLCISNKDRENQLFNHLIHRSKSGLLPLHVTIYQAGQINGDSKSIEIVWSLMKQYNLELHCLKLKEPQRFAMREAMDIVFRESLLQRNIQIIEILLRCNINEVNDFGRLFHANTYLTLSQLLWSNQSVQVMELLLEYGHCPTEIDINIALTCGDLDLLRLLFKVVTLNLQLKKQ